MLVEISQIYVPHELKDPVWVAPSDFQKVL